MPDIDVKSFDTKGYHKESLAFSDHAAFKKISHDVGDIQDPFAVSEGPPAFFPESSRLELLELLSQLFLPAADPLSHHGLLVLGNKGVGKTALAEEFVNHYAEELDINVVLVNAGQLDSEAELFKAVLTALGMAKPVCSTVEQFQQALGDMARLSHECGRSVMVMVDDAHNMAGDLVALLLESDAYCVEKNAPVNWVFFSEPGLERVFEALSRKYKSLAIEKNFYVQRVQPFSYEAMMAYVNFKFIEAGINEAVTFSLAQWKAIFNVSQGNAGLIPKATYTALGEWAGGKSLVVQMPKLHLWAAAGVTVFVVLLMAISFLPERGVWDNLNFGTLTAEQGLVDAITETKISWFLEQNPQHYTLQLVGAGEVGKVDEFIVKYSKKVGNNSLYKLITVRKNKDWYVVFCGVFDNRSSAVAFIEHLPETLKNSKPWARSFQHIQQDLLSKQSVSLLNQ